MLRSKHSEAVPKKDPVRLGRRASVKGQERLESSFISAPIGMAFVDLGGRWLRVNDAFCRIIGQTQDELMATTLRAVTHPEDIERDERSVHDLLDGAIPSYQVEKRLRHSFGNWVWVLLTVSLVRDPGGEPIYVVTQAQDISERKAQSARLEHLIDHDFLTGLLNRRRFQQELNREAERMARYGAKGAVLMIDLDNFKSVNDSLGHKAGDDLLRSIAGTLRHHKRRTDVLARVGGDEFAVLLPETDADQAEIVARGIVKALGRQVAVHGDQPIQITASVGVAALDGLPVAEALEFADLAMYEAKAAGRNRVVVHQADDDRPGQTLRRTDVEWIRSALDENRLLLHCQPIVNLKLNENAAGQYELLLRLQTGEGNELLLPNSFLYVAERFNLIQEIDGWVLHEAVELIREYARVGRKLILHVNLSGKSVGDARVAANLERTIAASGIDPACLVLELTETTAMTHVEEVKAFMLRPGVRGCRFALDDFGAGFGSFHSLKALPFDYFKIDGDFIRGIVANPTDALVVRAIVGIVKGLGKQTIAECVPNEETYRLLMNCGVDLAQGYHVGRPRPLREVLPPS